MREGRREEENIAVWGLREGVWLAWDLLKGMTERTMNVDVRKK